MRQGDLPERPALLCAIEDLWVEPIRTADDNADLRTLHLPLVKALSNHLSAYRFTLNVQGDNVILVSELRPDSLCLLLAILRGVAAPRFAGGIEPLNRYFPGYATRVLRDSLIHPCRHFLSYCQHSKPHQLLPGWAA